MVPGPEGIVVIVWVCVIRTAIRTVVVRAHIARGVIDLRKHHKAFRCLLDPEGHNVASERWLAPFGHGVACTFLDLVSALRIKMVDEVIEHSKINVVHRLLGKWIYREGKETQ